MKKITATVGVGAILLVLGACGVQKPQYYIRVVDDRGGQICLSVNNYEGNGSTFSPEDPSEGEVDRSGVYCRVEARTGDPTQKYPKP